MEGEVGNVLKMVISVGIVIVVAFLASVYRRMVMEPKRIRSLLKKQGISGPPPGFFLGNLLHIKKEIDALTKSKHEDSVINHDCSSYISPYLRKWIQNYGEAFMLALGPVKTILHVSETELVKELSTNTSWDLGKSSYLQNELGPLYGHGIISSNGATWALQRRILAPTLYLDKVKEMMNLITDSSVALIRSWEKEIETGGGGGEVDLEIGGYLRTFFGDVISKACFGKNYSQGEEIFSKINSLEEALSGRVMAMGIPAMRYIPTKKNKEVWTLEKEVHKLILEVVKDRKKEGTEIEDLLQMVIDGAESSDFTSQNAKDKFIVDNCKNIYLAGSETTAAAASWCIMVLASNQEWQIRVREEVVRVCEGQIPTTSMLLQMKELTMVVREVLRLYSPVQLMARQALNDLKIGDMYVPKGVGIWSSIFRLHTNPKLWGGDSYEFNPHRFTNGITGACKSPHMYIPFGFGARVCIGQHLAMAELKTLICLIVTNFQFSLSPKYIHSPTLKQVVVPEYGVNIIVKRL